MPALKQQSVEHSARDDGIVNEKRALSPER